MPRVAHLIFNPISGQGDPEADLDCLRSHLAPSFDLTVHQTTPQRGAYALAAQAIEQGVDLVIAAGGDGTVNAVAAALIGTPLPLAIIPRGTANAVASALGIPTNLEDACKTAISGEPRGIDTASCNGHPMVLLAGIGIEAEIVESTSREAKDRMGILAYILSGLQHLRQLNRFAACLEMADRTISVEASAITVANVAPPTSILAQGPAQVIADDGLLDITIVAPEGFGGALAASYELFRSAVAGEATQRDDIGYLRSSSVTIRTDPPQKVVLDGESLGETPLEVSCVPQGLRLISPQHPRSDKVEDLEGLPGLMVKPQSVD